MPRRLRIDAPGLHFHVTTRGVEKRAIFLDHSDRELFLKILATACRRYGTRCHAFCLMDNHYHLLLESVKGRIAATMQYLNGCYGREFNRRKRRVGHLFQGRFGANLIDRDAYFLEVVRYIELNPCRARLVTDPVDWKWSSFRPRVTGRRVPPGLCTDDVLRMFGEGIASVRRYGSFIRDGLPDVSLRRKLRDELILGSSVFVARHTHRARLGQTKPRASRRPGIVGRLGLAEILGEAHGADLSRRAVRAYLEFGFSLTEIARAIGVHHTTVSRWIRHRESDDAQSDDAQSDPDSQRHSPEERSL